MRRVMALVFVPLVIAALIPMGAAAKGGHLMLLNAPPARADVGSVWTARLRVIDHRGHRAWGSPADLVLVERRSHRRLVFHGPLSDRAGRASVRVRFSRPGEWRITGLGQAVTSTTVGGW